MIKNFIKITSFIRVTFNESPQKLIPLD